MKTLIEIVDRLAPIGFTIWLINDLMLNPDHLFIAIAGIGGWLCYANERRYSIYLTNQLARILKDIKRTNA